jgi:prepilin-type N-terminal cleavage/methylation domain-containing protein/prepilin-type processing-associated H-X9-DG protein
MKRNKGFSLIELLIVIAIIAILAALLFPVLDQAKQRAWTAQCISNLRQIGMGMKMFADDNGGFYPESGNDIYWNAIDPATGKASWMQQIYSYTMGTNVYNCPGNVQLPPAMRGPFNYFNGTRAAFIKSGGVDAAVDTSAIRFPAAYVLSGDTCGIPNNSVGEGPGFTFDPLDADKDDYSQNCVGGPTNGTPYELWQVHSGGQNVLFGDGHAKWYKSYDANDMTFHYTVIASWAETNMN